MADILIFFLVYIQIILTSLILEFKYQKNFFILDEASEANLNTDKRILKCQPLLHWVYNCFVKSVLVLSLSSQVGFRCLVVKFMLLIAFQILAFLLQKVK